MVTNVRTLSNTSSRLPARSRSSDAAVSVRVSHHSRSAWFAAVPVASASSTVTGRVPRPGFRSTESTYSAVRLNLRSVASVGVAIYASSLP